MGGIKAFIVLPVAALDLAVMPWRVGADQFMPDPVLSQTALEEGGLSLFEVKRLVNSEPLSVCMHSMWQGKAFTRWSTKRAEE